MTKNKQRGGASGVNGYVEPIQPMLGAGTEITLEVSRGCLPV
jgi:hypothetical protein